LFAGSFYGPEVGVLGLLLLNVAFAVALWRIAWRDRAGSFRE
jgi:hypothetical protein